MQTSLSVGIGVFKKKKKKNSFLLLFDREDQSACDEHISIYNVTDQSLMKH